MWSQRLLTKLDGGGLLQLHSAADSKVTWLIDSDVAIRALTKDRNKINYMQDVVIRCWWSLCNTVASTEDYKATLCHLRATSKSRLIDSLNLTFVCIKREIIIAL